MIALAKIEAQRLEIQRTRDGAKSAAERNRLGQFATPPALASAIVECAVRLLPDGQPVRFFDPAFGTGAFYSALLGTIPRARIVEALGYEIDPHYGRPAMELWHQTGLRLEICDFTRAVSNGTDQFNLLVCNPPYVRHHHIPAAEKERLQEATLHAAGIHLSGLAGLYCHFLALAQPWMTAGGLAVWLVPSEFMDVNYGKAVRDYLLSRVTLLRIHRFDPNDVQFDDALVSSAVVWFRNQPPPEGHRVEFSFGGKLSDPQHRAAISATDLRREAKWTRFPLDAVRVPEAGPILSDLFDIKRGLATGANEVFILSADQVAEHGLPSECLRPILPSPRNLRVDEVHADAHGNPIGEEPRFLLDCRLREAEVAEKFPALWRYFETKKSLVGSRYLCGKRTPWFLQEKRPAAPFICTYIGRSDTKSGRPFRFILNHSQATAANVYLMLYPKQALVKAMAERPPLKREIWRKLNEIDIATILGEGRVYGGGLHKMEPRELANVPARSIATLLHEPIEVEHLDVDLFTGALIREEPPAFA